MENLSIIGVFVSVVSVVLSLLLFNASVNNSRKIVLNNILQMIEKNLFYAFNVLVNDEERINYIHDFVSRFREIDSELQKIKFTSNIGIPLIPMSTQYLDNNKVRQVYDFNLALDNLFLYFKKRNLEGIDLLFDFYIDRHSVLQFFYRKIKYKRLLLIGPIIGLSIEAVRQREEICYTSKICGPIKVKKIRNQSDFEEYYKNSFLPINKKLPPINGASTEWLKFERSDLNIVINTEKGKERNHTLYV